MSLGFMRYVREKNLERCAHWHRHGVADWDLNQWFTAAAGEVGEALEAFAEWASHDLVATGQLVINGEPGDPVRAASRKRTKARNRVVNELCDVTLYLDLLAARAGHAFRDPGVRYAHEIGETLSMLRAAQFVLVVGDTIKKLNRDHDRLAGNTMDFSALSEQLADELDHALAALNAAFRAFRAEPQTALCDKFNAVSKRNGFHVFMTPGCTS
ncbi:MAG: hypothetical protein ABL308_12800 [Oceanicaulis sp.]